MAHDRMRGAATLPAAPSRNSIWLKLVYGAGSMAFGIKDNGFQTILLIFYNQVVGLPPTLVGIAIMIALAVDAIMDPIIGEISDNLRTPIGRRHPLMYAAAVPLGLSYLLLWSPPHASRGLLFCYLVGVSIVVRTFVSLYEAPSQALAPELTTNYAERTSLMSYRAVFQWFGGLLIYALAFLVFLTPDRAHKVGQLNPVGYQHYGAAAGALMTISILISALGTQNRVKSFVQPPARKRSLGQTLAEVRMTVSNRSYLMLLGSNFFAAAAGGLALSMNLYFYTYLWGLNAKEIAAFVLPSIAAAVAGAVLARLVTGRNKRSATAALFIVGLVISSAPMALRVCGLFLPNGHPWLFPILLINSALGLTPIIAATILGASMIADVVEDSQVTTGRRSEGLFFAGATFIQKATSGVGIFLSSLMLAAIRFPANAASSHAAVPPGMIRELVLIYLPTVVVLFLISLAWLAGYRITRETHDASLRLLAVEAAEGVAVIPQI
jgi:Na+/melibiose symporter-like transporter